VFNVNKNVRGCFHIPVTSLQVCVFVWLCACVCMFMCVCMNVHVRGRGEPLLYFDRSSMNPTASLHTVEGKNFCFCQEFNPYPADMEYRVSS
jgi:hypothetical protein